MRVPDTNPKPRFSLELFRKLVPELDLFGFALFAPASVMFLLALQFGGNDYAWNSSVIIGLFCGAGATATFFCPWEYRMGDRAMMPGFLLKQRIVLCSLLHMACTMTLVSVPSYFLPSYFQSVLGTSPTMSGVDMLPNIVSQLLLIVLSGAAREYSLSFLHLRVVARTNLCLTVKVFGYYLVYAVGGATVSSVGMGLLSLLSPTSTTGQWIGYQILAGAGRGSSMQMVSQFCATKA